MPFESELIKKWTFSPYFVELGTLCYTIHTHNRLIFLMAEKFPFIWHVLWLHPIKFGAIHD